MNWGVARRGRDAEREEKSRKKTRDVWSNAKVSGGEEEVETRGRPREAEPVARHGSGRAEFRKSQSSAAQQAPRVGLQREKKTALGSRQWATAPGARLQARRWPLPRPCAGRSAARAARAGQAAEKEGGRESDGRVPARRHTYPRRGKVPAPARRLRPSSRRALEPPRASARRGAGTGRKGKRGGKRSGAGAQPLQPLGRAAAEPAGAGRGGQGAFGNGDGPGWRGSGTSTAAARGHNPGGGRRRGAGRGGARTPPSRPEARSCAGRRPAPPPRGRARARAAESCSLKTCGACPVLCRVLFFVFILRETASSSFYSALSPVRSVPTKDAGRRLRLYESAPGHLFLGIHTLSILLFTYKLYIFPLN